MIPLVIYLYFYYVLFYYHCFVLCINKNYYNFYVYRSMLHIITHYYCTGIVQYAPVFGRLTGDLASNPFDY